MAGDAFARPIIHLAVQVPGDTTTDAKIFVTGSSAELGDWRPDGLPLQRSADGSYVTDVDLALGSSVEFKITRGSWDTVEKLADGSKRPNRSVTIDANTKTIEVTVERWADGPEKIASTVVGTLQLHTIESKTLAAPRTIRVWLPPGYDADPQAHFDVLYMHDGQNLFDRATSAFRHEWEIDETLTKLIAEKKIRPIIVVGIDNGGAERINEMTYAADQKHGGGHAAAYAKFLIDDVKPFVEKTYRVEPGPAHTFLGGSSLGGLVSLDLVRRNPNIFGGVIAMSPSLWWPAEPITPAVSTDAGGLKTARVWLDIGTGEGDEGAIKSASYVDDAKRFDAALTQQHVVHHLTVEGGAKHNEEAWARRFPDAIQYLLAQ